LPHRTLLRRPAGRAVFHFTGAALLRVQRYRIYLVLSTSRLEDDEDDFPMKLGLRN
jgi:hypothetical protein